MPNQPQIFLPESNAPTIVYKPSELLGIIASYFSQQDVSKQVIFLQGIYWKNPKNNPAWAYRYDVLRDENTQSEVAVQQYVRFHTYLSMLLHVNDDEDICQNNDHYKIENDSADRVAYSTHSYTTLTIGQLVGFKFRDDPLEMRLVLL